VNSAALIGVFVEQVIDRKEEERMTEGSVQVKDLPKVAGVALLNYSPDVRVPARSGNTISIPASDVKELQCRGCKQKLRTEWTFCPICATKCPERSVKSLSGDMYKLDDGFRQFLFHIPSRDSYSGGSVWFGGTDEAPFLVQMQPQVLRLFKDGSFYQSLVPKLIQRICENAGTEYRRQGDIFAAPIGMSLDKFESDVRSWFYIKPLVFDEVGKKGGRISIFGTRHGLTSGRYCNTRFGGSIPFLSREE